MTRQGHIVHYPKLYLESVTPDGLHPEAVQERRLRLRAVHAPLRRHQELQGSSGSSRLSWQEWIEMDKDYGP